MNGWVASSEHRCEGGVMMDQSVCSGTKVAGIAGNASQPADQLVGIARARSRVDRLLKRIRTAHDSGQHKKVHQLARLYLASFDAHYLAAEEAWRKLPKGVRPEASALSNWAHSLNPWVGTQEKVVMRPVEKPRKPGCFRTVLRFGFEHRALQFLVLQLLKAQADLHPNQYLMRGSHAAIKRVAQLMEMGHTWAVETDIASCYPSFDGEKLLELLPVPKEVTRNVLLSVTYDLLLHPSFCGPAGPDENDEIIFPELFADARRGLPQGSAASPLVAEMLLAPLFDNLLTSGAWIGYADNFLAMGKNPSDAVSMTKALWSALKAHPAGQLGPNNPGVLTLTNSIKFLGHRLRLSNGAIRIDPSFDNLDKFEAAMKFGLQMIKKSSSKTARERKVRKLQRYVRSWAGAFGLCTDIGHHRETALKRIAMAA
jgi:hypothetical protein